MADNVIYLTRDWFIKLQDELEYLKSTKRIEIAEKLKEAISFWDLSENSEYEEARAEQAQVEKRIIDLEEQLKNVQIIEESNKKENKVKIWATVLIENEEWEQREYKIVGTTESDILWKPSKISNESPVWKALIWKKKWDIVTVKLPSWTYNYKVVKIS